MLAYAGRMLTYAGVCRTYASSALTEITSLDSLSLNELRAFVKDMRCSTRVVMKLVLTLRRALLLY